jgi:hypothetical protein
MRFESSMSTIWLRLRRSVSSGLRIDGMPSPVTATNDGYCGLKIGQSVAAILAWYLESRRPGNGPEAAGHLWLPNRGALRAASWISSYFF